MRKLHLPLASLISQRHVADRSAAAAEYAAHAVRQEAAAEPRRVEDDRRCRPAEAHPELVEAELLAGELPACRSDVKRRAADTAVEHRRIDPRRRPAAGRTRALEMIGRPIGQTGSRVGPSFSGPVWSELKLTTSHAVPNAKLPPRPIWPSIGTRSACTRPFGNGPSSWAAVLSRGRPPPASAKRIGAIASRAAAGAVGRDISEAVHWCAGTRLLEVTRPLGSPPPAIWMSLSIRRPPTGQ